MTGRERLAPRALVPLAVAGLLIPLTGTAPTAAVTSQAIVHSGLYPGGQAWFYSGNDGEHGTADEKGGAGFNSFVLADLNCDDGLTIGVTWVIAGRNGTEEIPRGECRQDDGVAIDYQTSEFTEMSWRAWAKDADGRIRHLSAWQQDWFGSINTDGRGYFEKSAVYHDQYHGQLGITVSVWPTEATKDTAFFDTDQIRAMWAELGAGTPLPNQLTRDEVESIFKQFVCHAQWAYTAGETGGTVGDSWDFEAWRPNIPMDEAVWGVKEYECNWDTDEPSSNIPPVDWPHGKPPIVFAGPDVASDEGAAVELRGSAVDETGEPPLRWTYAPVSGVDADATCDFADEQRPSTTVTCTDDGQYRVTLTADDGVNEPVSDSAVLTVRNVAPTLTLNAPESWAV